MMDYWAVSGLDWSRVRFPEPAPCPHGLMGAPYCITCLTPILQRAIDEQETERLTTERDQLLTEVAALNDEREEPPE